MAQTVFYRYVDAHGHAHFADSESAVPHDHRGAVDKLTLAHEGLPQNLNTAITDASSQMHWPSFGFGLGAASLVFLVLRIVSSKRLWFVGAAVAIAVMSMGSAGYLKSLERALPASLTGHLPTNELPSPAEARRILERLPKAGQDRDRILEQIFASDK